jgi:hypothetical protein
MNVMASALVVLMALAVGGTVGVLTWGLVLEARSNRDWRERSFGR